MIYIGIDISKYKHDCCIISDTGEFIVENFTFLNNQKGFQSFLELLKPYDKSLIKVALEATGHYGINLKLFLENNNLLFMEFNPVLVKQFKDSQSLRRTKTDKVDSFIITQKLMSVKFTPCPKGLYHKNSIKSLTRLRESLIKERSKYLVKITNVLDKTFPEFKPFFNNKLSSTAIYILKRYKNASKIYNARDYDSISKISRGKFSYASFVKLKELAKNTVGETNDILEFELHTLIDLFLEMNTKIDLIDKEISTIIKELNPAILTIPGIGEISAAAIVSEFGDISNYANANKMLAFAGLEPSVIQSGTVSHKGKMVKRGSGHLRYVLMNVANTVIIYNTQFYDYYNKKRLEGKAHRVALSHVCKKLLRVIYHLETNNLSFDSSLLK